MGGGNFYFTPTEKQFTEEKEEWDKIAQLNPVEHLNEYKIFLAGHPAGYFAALARNIISTTPPPPPPKPIFRVSSPMATLLSLPLPTAAVVGKIKEGTQVTAIADSQDYKLVRRQNGDTAYIDSNDLKRAPTTEKRVILPYGADTVSPLEKLKTFLDSLDLNSLIEIDLVSRAENMTGDNQVAVVTDRLVKLQALLTARKISPAIVKTSILTPDDRAPHNEIEVIAKIIASR